MNNYREWIIRYHGDLKKALTGIDIMMDVINERYAIIKATEKEIPYLRTLSQIECLEESKPIYPMTQEIDWALVSRAEKEKHGVSGKGVTVGWIGHNEHINYNNYNTYDGKTRILCVHDGIRQYNKQQITYTGHNYGEHRNIDGLSSMDMCIGNGGIAPDSEIILVNWKGNNFCMADAIRAVRFIINKTNSKKNPLVICLPFDIAEDIDGHNSLAQEIISEMTMWGQIAIVSSISPGNQTLDLNLRLSKGPIFSTCAPLTVGVISLVMDWGIVRGNDPLLYGQRLRTYYLKNMALLLKEHSPYTRFYSLDGLDELLKLLIPVPGIEAFRTLELAYEFAPDNEKIDVFIVYNNLKESLTIIPPQTADFYPLIFPYLGVRGTVTEIREILSGYLETLITGSLAYILGREPLEIRLTNFENASIFSASNDLKGAGTLIGIIDTGIDYTNPAFLDSKGETRIVGIWDQTIGVNSPYGYGTIYDREVINEALKSEDPFEVLPHKDEWGSGTMLAGIAAGFSEENETIYKGVAPEADIVVVKLIPATPTMQGIYHSQYTPLGFSALDIARAFEYLVTLANQYQKPISICMAMGTNSGPHDGRSVLDTIIMNYAKNPGVCVVLPAGEEANKRHHASGDLNTQIEQEIKLIIPENEGGFIIEVWASFGDRIEVSLTTPKLEAEESYTILLNRSQTYKITNGSFVWCQGSEIDYDTGCQMIRFRLIKPFPGDWVITVKGIVVIEGIYNIWIPKTGMILPETVLSPANPFTTIYNTSSSTGLITVSCYDKKSSSPTPSSGRGFARDNRVKPDFMVPGVNIPGPLPENGWGLITGTAAATAVTIGFSSLIFENQLALGEKVGNTMAMKAILISQVVREPTLSYPDPSRGYGLLDINATVH